MGKSTRLSKMISVESDRSDYIGASNSSVISNTRITHEAIRPVALRDPTFLHDTKDYSPDHDICGIMNELYLMFLN